MHTPATHPSYHGCHWCKHAHAKRPCPPVLYGMRHGYPQGWRNLLPANWRPAMHAWPRTWLPTSLYAVPVWPTTAANVAYMARWWGSYAVALVQVWAGNLYTPARWQ